MIKTLMAAAVLTAGMASMSPVAQAQDRGLAQGTQGRPHDGNFAEEMMLRRHHMTRMQYRAMRMRNERMQMRMHHHSM